MKELTPTVLIIGLLLVFTKAADIILLEKQKHWLNANTALLQERLAKVSARRVFALVASKPLIVLQSIPIAIGLLAYLWDGLLSQLWHLVKSLSMEPDWSTFLWASFSISITVFSVRIAAYLSGLLGFPKTFFEPAGPGPFALRYTASAGLAVLLFMAPFLVVIPAAFVGGTPAVVVGTLLLIAGGVVLFPVSLWFTILSISFLPAVLITSCYWLLGVALMLFKGLLARVLEYNKGVFAALVLIATTVLAALELISKHAK